MKIPTFLGLFILFLLSAVLVYGSFFVQKNSQNSKIAAATIPLNLAQNNIGQDSITVTWETSFPTATELIVSNSSNMNPIFQHLRDDRDLASSEARLTHISTINNLLPNTGYFIKTKINGTLYPTTDTQIKTTSVVPPPTNYNPIVGSIVDQNLRPVDDGLVFLLIEDAYPLSTGIHQDGNFILPLNSLVNKTNPSNPISAQSLANATLVIHSGNQKSEVEINLDNDFKPLAPIVLGQNFDFRKQASPSANLQN